MSHALASQSTSSYTRLIPSFTHLFFSPEHQLNLCISSRRRKLRKKACCFHLPLCPFVNLGRWGLFSFQAAALVSFNLTVRDKMTKRFHKLLVWSPRTLSKNTKEKKNVLTVSSRCFFHLTGGVYTVKTGTVSVKAFGHVRGIQ